MTEPAASGTVRDRGASPGDLFSKRVIRSMSLTTALLLLTLGCRGGDRTTGPEAPEATALEMGPSAVYLTEGETAQLEATPVDGNGNPVSGYEVTWSSGNTAVATVDGDGTVTAVDTGSAKITARAQKTNNGKGSDNGKGKKKGLEKHSDVTVTDGGLIAELEPAAYEKDTLEAGDSVYIDRTYTIDEVPERYRGWRYVRTANDDKAITSDSAVAFTLADTARVALAYDERATRLPGWLEQWTATGDTLVKSGADHAIFTRVFGPGDVVLGGNMSDGAEGAENMYVLYATRTSSAPDDAGGGTTNSATGSLAVDVATSGESLDPDGYTVTVDGASGKDVGIDGSVTFTGLATGDHTVSLSGVASNCSVAGSPTRTASVSDGATTSLSFEVSCEAMSEGQADPVWTDDFESGTYNAAPGKAEGYGWSTWRPWPGESDHIEVNSENPRTGDYSMMIRFPDGGDLNADGMWPDGTKSMNIKAKWQVPDLKEFWFEMYVYVPDNYTHPEVVNSSDNRKFWAVWDIDRRDDQLHLFNELVDGTDTRTPNRTSLARYFIETRGQGSSTNWFSNGGGDGCGNTRCIGDLFTPEDRGTWVRLRYHVKLSSFSGAEDGEWHAWKDNELIMAHTGLDWEPPEGGNYFFRNGQLLGAQNSKYPQETKFYFDDFKIWKSDPGWW